MKRALATIACALVLTVTAPTVHADAVVNVSVHGAQDGSVVLSGDGGRFTCTVSQGRCTIRSVPGGRYSAVFTPKGGKSTAPKKVMIPPSGSADLHISAK